MKHNIVEKIIFAYGTTGTTFKNSLRTSDTGTT